MQNGESFFGENEEIIGSASSVEEIIHALARRGCLDLTSSIDPAQCSKFPCAGGGFCDVFKGALSGGFKIAIKSLRIYDGPEAEGDSNRRKILKRAARELYHWSKLQHCNILPLMGLAMFRGHISMVSPWLEKGNLMVYLKLNPDVDRIQLCMDVCEGLLYIHTREMVHGDLKAANIMVATNGTAMVADFGNAQLNELTMKFTSATKRGFSVRWAAPELLLQDDGPQMSKEADVYAYGMTVLEALTGEVPYNGVTEHRVICLVAYEQKTPPRPDAVISDGLWDLLNSCWTRDPTGRPSVMKVRDRLQALFRPPAKSWSTDSANAPLLPLEKLVESQLVPCTKAYVCPFFSCGRLYREPRFLKEHIRLHLVDKPYQCQRCFKQFSRTDYLTQHHQTHARADNGDPQALLDLERVDEEEIMWMGEKICEVEVRGEVEDVAGEPGQLRGLGVVCIYPLSNTDQSAPFNFPDPDTSPKSDPPHRTMAHWRAEHAVGSLSSTKSVPGGRWPSDIDAWDLPRSQSVLGYAWDQRSVSPAYSAISRPIAHAPYRRPNTTDPTRASVGSVQPALSPKQSFEPLHRPSHPAPGAQRRHRDFQSHRHMSMALRRTSAGGPDEVDLAGVTSRYHPYGHAAANVNQYSSTSGQARAPYPQAVDQRAASTLSNVIDGTTPEATYSMNPLEYPAVPNNGNYPEEHDVGT